MFRNLLSISGHDAILIIATAHKVGSTWVFDILRSYYNAASPEIHEDLRKNFAHKHILPLESYETKSWVETQQGINIFKSHDHVPNWISEKNERIKVVTVIRDPRDLMVSSYFYIKELQPELGGWPELKELDLKSGIRYWLDRNELDFTILKEWYAEPAVIKLRYENLLNDTFAEFKKVIDHINISKFKEAKLRAVLESNSFERRAQGRKRGQEDTKSFYRKGISGDWINYFDEEIKSCFKEANGGRWNELLVELGYEKSLAW